MHSAVGCRGAVGVARLIVLDLARVGTGTVGAGTGRCCGRSAHEYPDVEADRRRRRPDWDDVDRLEDAGADAVLVASALHDGTLTFPRPAS